MSESQSDDKIFDSRNIILCISAAEGAGGPAVSGVGGIQRAEQVTPLRGPRYWRSGWTDQSGESVGIFHLGDFSIISKLKKTNNQTYAVLPAAKTEGGKLLFKLFQYISKIQ